MAFADPSPASASRDRALLIVRASSVRTCTLARSLRSKFAEDHQSVRSKDGAVSTTPQEFRRVLLERMLGEARRLHSFGHGPNRTSLFVQGLELLPPRIRIMSPAHEGACSISVTTSECRVVE